jgi:hypothetical protein
MNGKELNRVRLHLGILSRNLLLEEYPLAEKYISPLDNGGWLLDTEVASYAGVARFVVGLMDDILIIDTPELEQYIANYIEKFWPQVCKK